MLAKLRAAAEARDVTCFHQDHHWAVMDKHGNEIPRYLQSACSYVRELRASQRRTDHHSPSESKSGAAGAP